MEDGSVEARYAAFSRIDLDEDKVIMTCRASVETSVREMLEILGEDER